jgi:hypothetical protein
MASKDTENPEREKAVLAAMRAELEERDSRVVSEALHGFAA